MKANISFYFSGLLMLLFILAGCSLFNPTGTEVVVQTADGEPITNAVLSPDGKKLLYSNNHATRFILDLVSGEMEPIDTCIGIWLDNDRRFCENARLIVDTSDDSRIGLQDAEAEILLVPDKAEGVEVLYKLPAAYPVEPTGLVVLMEDPEQSVYIPDLPDDFEFPPTVPTPIVPLAKQRREEVPSPDGQYYYARRGGAINIYSVADDHLLSKVSIDGEQSTTILGWVYDSSGVLYHSSHGMLDFTPNPIYKLKVPE